MPPKPEVPDWAIPRSATHKQVAPPADFHRETLTLGEPLNGFTVSEIGTPLVRGSSSFTNGSYTVSSAGYNVWYTRDEFRLLWKQMKGDVSLAADIAFPDPNGYGDRKAVLVIRQELADDSKQVVVALHGAGMIGLNSFQISVPESPFGGVKESGHGSEEGIEGLEACLVTTFISLG